MPVSIVDILSILRLWIFFEGKDKHFNLSRMSRETQGRLRLNVPLTEAIFSLWIIMFWAVQGFISRKPLRPPFTSLSDLHLTSGSLSHAHHFLFFTYLDHIDGGT